jgi:hypothetical protein
VQCAATRAVRREKDWHSPFSNANQFSPVAPNPSYCVERDARQPHIDYKCDLDGPARRELILRSPISFFTFQPECSPWLQATYRCKKGPVIFRLVRVCKKGRASQMSGSRQGPNRSRLETIGAATSYSVQAPLVPGYDTIGHGTALFAVQRSIPSCSSKFDAQLSRFVSQLQIKKSKTTPFLVVEGVEKWVCSSGRASRSRLLSRSEGYGAPGELLRTGTNIPHSWVETARSGWWLPSRRLMSSPTALRSSTISQDCTIQIHLSARTSHCAPFAICAPLIASIN